MSGNIIPVTADISDSTNSILKELALPAVTQVGLALGNVFGLLNTFTLPVKFGNEFAQRNYKKYADKLDDIPEESIKQVEPEIAIPIMEKLSYTTNEDLANAYANLLASASDKNKVNQVHPGFINKIQNLAPDEVKLLEYIRTTGNAEILYFTYKVINSKTNNFKTITVPLTGIELLINIDVKQMAIHINNLISLNIIEDNKGNHKTNDEEYKKLRATYLDIETIFEDRIKKQYYPTLDKLEIDKSFYNVTPLGEIFIKSCTNSK